MSVYIFYYYGINCFSEQKNENNIIVCLPFEELWY